MGIHDFFISIYPLGVEPTLIKEEDGRATFSMLGSATIKTDDIRSYLRNLYGKENHTLKHGYPKRVRVPLLFYNPYDTYRYVHNGTILVQLTVDNDKPNCWELSLGGCYAWYPEGLEEMYTIFESLNNQFLLLNPYFIFDQLPKTKDGFIEQAKQRFDEHWKFFQTMYPLHEPILQTKFYKYVNNFHYRLYHRLLKRRRSWIR